MNFGNSNGGVPDFLSSPPFNGQISMNATGNINNSAVPNFSTIFHGDQEFNGGNHYNGENSHSSVYHPNTDPLEEYLSFPQRK